MICTWPVEVSAGVAKFWFAPLFGHSIAWPPEAAASLTTVKGENRLWPERLSSSTASVLLPAPLLDDELELELEEVEPLLELEELPLEPDEELDDELLEELEELELEELLDDELLDDELELEEVPPSQPMGASPTTISSIHTSALLLLKLCQPNIA